MTERIHLVGVAGAGMMPLAVLLKAAGYDVSGSDASSCSAATGRLAALKRLGIEVYAGHASDRLRGVGGVIASPAIPADNIEIRTARRLGIQVKKRSQALAELMANRESVGVAGSHGKSTTTAMLAHILQAANPDAGYMVGADVPSLHHGPAKLGASSAPFVFEACEAHGALQDWHPRLLVLTNVDDDHVEHYGADRDLRGAFAELVRRAGAKGGTIACGDDPGNAAILKDADGAFLTYGFAGTNDFVVMPGSMDGAMTAFEIVRDGHPVAKASTRLAGDHNVLNAAAAIICANALGVDWAIAAEQISTFDGVSCRFEYMGTESGVRVFDDFAHHPTEIAASVSAARNLVREQGRVVVVLQPQLHSRVSRKAAAFASALAKADVAVVLPVEGLGEGKKFADGDTSLALALQTIATQIVNVANADQAAKAARKISAPGDVVVVMSASSTRRIAPAILEALKTKQPSDALSISYQENLDTARAPSVLEALDHWSTVEPDRIFGEYASERLSYREISSLAQRFANDLISRGLRPGQTVAGCLARSLNRAVAFLGTLWAQGVFLPIDPGLPSTRVAFMLEDASAKFVLTDALHANKDFAGVEVIRMDGAAATPSAQQPLSFPASDQAAYVIYTSGTTGTPKGVVVAHQSLTNFAHCAARVFDINRSSRVSQLSAFGFDVSVGDLASAVVSGACLVFPTDIQALPGSPMGRFILEKKISHLSLTPSALMALPAWRYPVLQHIVVAGEACPPDLVNGWSTRHRFYNAYGPTEATIFATFDECKPQADVTIGRPFDNVGICIVDDNLRPVPLNTMGEMCIFGACLSEGYLNQKELTASRFPQLQLPGIGGVRVYRTGDHATMLSDGRITFAGRADQQIKLRGFRIELGEIEETLRRHPSVQDAAVIVHGAGKPGANLVAYVVLRSAGELTRELLDFLGEHLPGYMLPSQIVQIDAMPTTINGKRNLAALPSPHVAAASVGLRQPKQPRTATEVALADIYRNILSLPEPIGTRDHLRDLNVDSLQVANLYMAIEDTFGVELKVDIANEADTIELMGLYLDQLDDLPAQRSLPASQDLEADFARKQRGFLAAWDGEICGPSGLIRRLNPDQPHPALFWCCQGMLEHTALASVLAERPVYGLRSGHLIFNYSDENIRALARLYANELTAVQREGPFFIGGNCQGGTIAQHVAMRLMELGREVRLLILMEPGRFVVYPAPVALAFGTESHLNPYRSIDAPDRIFAAAFRGGYSVDLIPGSHGTYFDEPAISRLGTSIRARIDEASRSAPLEFSHPKIACA